MSAYFEENRVAGLSFWEAPANPPRVDETLLARAVGFPGSPPEPREAPTVRLLGDSTAWIDWPATISVRCPVDRL
jgi:hypothetical protein